MHKHSSPTHALLLALAVALSLAGCDDSHSHDGEAGHDHGAAEEPHGHEHAEDRPTHVVTMAGEHTELFVEFPALVAGYGSQFAAHFTTLGDYKPVRSGKLSVILTSDASPGERWEATEPARPGIFTPTATPKYVAERQLILLLETEAFTERFDLGVLPVFDTKEAASKVAVNNPEGEVSFLKEQQWMVNFDVAEARIRPVRPSVIANATLRPAADAEAVVTAPFDGRISAPEGGLPQVGKAVEEGEVIAYVLPSLGAGEISQLRADLRKAKVELETANRELGRVDGLVSSGAIPGKRRRDAQSAREIAEADVEQAQQRLRQYNNLESRGGGGRGAGVAIRSPIAGTIAQRSLVDGGFVSSSDELLRVIDRGQLWLEAHLPEADLARIGQPTGAWFTTGEKGEVVEIDVESGGELVSFGQFVDPTTRTAPVIFAIGQTPAAESLRIGSFVEAHILDGAPREALTIPASAVLDEKGIDVVFVMRGGESFERRTVRLGIRDRGLVEVVDGLAPGERVVSRGAYFVKLASTSTAAVGHGHAH